MGSRTGSPMGAARRASTWTRATPSRVSARWRSSRSAAPRWSPSPIPAPRDASAEVDVARTFSTSGITERRHAYRVTATDGAGNVGSTEVWNVSVDRTEPDGASDIHLYKF